MGTSNYRWVMVAILWLLHAIAYLNMASLGILAPFIKNDLHLNSAEIGILISALSVGASLSRSYHLYENGQYQFKQSRSGSGRRGH